MTTITQSLWLPPTDRSVIVAMLLDACFPRADAEAWADGSTWTAGSSIVAAEAIAYDDHVIPLDEAIAWHAQGFEAAEAIYFYDRRYTLEQAITVINLTNQDIEWLATGLPADRVIAYLRAGVTLDEYGDWESSDATDDALTMLAAFLQAP
ncbi:hypothetical protein [Nocardioides panaciterrulae]|uniref:Uncharacterized protein n=1 Tax=Nocardioides panaciterrulae TaxID=661492 RepID=A0A7Y9E324_9ACTN|nr:hypothetical protein [Nocardioides panaciterrulae]NYD40021.1 hypothetical protein [Nocardioides panaciterrulae]